MRGKKTIVQSVKMAARAAGISEVVDTNWPCRCVDGDCYIGGDSWCAGWIGDPAHDQSAEGAVAWSDDITFGGVGIIIIDAARAVGSVARRD